MMKDAFAMIFRLTLFFVLALLPIAGVCTPALSAGSTGSQASPADPANSLQLTPEQQREVSERKQKFQADSRKIADDPTLTHEQKRAKISALEAAAVADLQSYLSVQQRAQLDAANAQFNKQAADRSAHIARLKEEIKTSTTEYVAKRRALVQSVTPDQKRRILALEDDVNNQLAKINSDSSLSADEKAKRVLALQTGYETKRSAIFSSEQSAILVRMGQIEQSVKEDEAEINRLDPLLLISPNP